jgi:hypothetical protein
VKEFVLLAKEYPLLYIYVELVAEYFVTTVPHEVVDMNVLHVVAMIERN